MLVNKKEKMEYRKKQTVQFLKSRNGKILIGVCAAVIVLAAGIGLWNRGSLAREGLKLCEKGDYTEAQTVFKNAVIEDNMNPGYYNYLGISCIYLLFVGNYIVLIICKCLISVFYCNGWFLLYCLFGNQTHR